MNAQRGIISFVFTDIVGSTRLWEKHPGLMSEAVRKHDALLSRMFREAGGCIFKTLGDSFRVAFDQPAGALAAAAAVQRSLAAADWGELGRLEVRVGVHSGPAEERGGDYFGATLSRAARIEAAAHGGQVLVSGATVELAAETLPPGISFRDLGEYRLRGLERTERLFQLVADGLETDFPPPRNIQGPPNNLPASTSSFVGRERELAAVLGHLRGGVKLLTLLGTGGTGKTRLALEAGACMAGEFPGGVWLAELAMISDASRLLGAVADAVGVREEGGRPLRDTLLEALRGQQLLLILDNCEHLSMAVAALASDLLRSCGSLKLLATSRNPLGVSGETTFPVPPLAIHDFHRHAPEGPGLLRRIEAYDAVKLFVDRAAAVRPDFVLTESNAAAVAEICARLDGIPLAIELAAARLRLLEPRQIADRLADRFRLLRGGAPDRLPHQQTLQALIDWSNDLLSEPEKVLFRRLAAFAGGRTLEAIEEVCSGGPVAREDVLDLLQGLVEKSLVSVEHDTGIRYTLIESVWEYAGAALAASGEREAILERHALYFLNWAEQAGPHFEAAGQARWLGLFDDEVFNLRRAMRWAIDHGRGAEAVRLLAALGRPLEVRSVSLTDALETAREILAMPAEVSPCLRSRAEAAAGRLAWALDLYDEARQRFTAAQALAEAAGDRHGAGLSRAFIGFLERGDGRTNEAEQIFKESLALAREIASPKLEALALGGLGRVAMERGRLAEARELAARALDIYRAVGDRWVTGLVLWGLARSDIALGQTQAAREALREWADIIRDLGNRWAMPYLLQTMASAALTEGDAPQAARLLGSAEALRERHGFQLSVTEQAELNADLSKLQDLLPADELTALWNAGREEAPWDFPAAS